MNKKSSSAFKGRLPTAALCAALFLGVMIMLYPGISDHWNSMHQSKAIAGYIKTVSSYDKERTARFLSEAKEYNLSLRTNQNRFFLSEKELSEYYSILDIDSSGIMGYIEIDRAKCRLPIYHGTDESTLQIAVGHIAGTSLPVGGKGTHCVLSGHRGLPSAKLFSDLDKLSPGDTFEISILNEVLTYEVDQSIVVLPSDISALAIDDESDLCTLITCTPYGVNSHRLLIRGHRTENKKNSAIRITSDAMAVDPSVAAPFFAAPLLCALLVIFIFRTNKRSRLKDLYGKLGIKRQ